MSRKNGPNRREKLTYKTMQFLECSKTEFENYSFFLLWFCPHVTTTSFTFFFSSKYCYGYLRGRSYRISILPILSIILTLIIFVILRQSTRITNFFQSKNISCSLFLISCEFKQMQILKKGEKLQLFIIYQNIYR